MREGLFDGVAWKTTLSGSLDIQWDLETNMRERDLFRHSLNRFQEVRAILPQFGVCKLQHQFLP